jgi:hypothetical protein
MLHLDTKDWAEPHSIIPLIMAALLEPVVAVVVVAVAVAVAVARVKNQSKVNLQVI